MDALDELSDLSREELTLAVVSPRDTWGPEFRVQGSGCRVQGAGFRVQGSGFRVQGSGRGVTPPFVRAVDAAARRLGLRHI